jgi:hypothetical protein
LYIEFTLLPNLQNLEHLPRQPAALIGSVLEGIYWAGGVQQKPKEITQLEVLLIEIFDDSHRQLPQI